MTDRDDPITKFLDRMEIKIIDGTQAVALGIAMVLAVIGIHVAWALLLAYAAGTLAWM